MSTDPMARLRSADPARRVDLSRVDPGALRVLREGITMTVREPEAVEGARDRKARRGLGRFGLGRRGTIAAGLSVVLAGGAIAFIVPERPRMGAGDVTCFSVWNEASESVGGAFLSGDPIADCAAYRATAGLEPLADPVAFFYDIGVYVTPRDQMPAGLSPLAPDPLASKALELKMSSEDWVDGAMSACEDPETAATRARSDLSRLGLEGWTVAIDDTPMADGSMRWACAGTWVDTRSHRVTVLPERAEDPATRTGPLELVADLRTGITDRCLSLADARAVADTALAAEDERFAAAYPDQDVSRAPGDIPIWSIPDESTSCARVDMEVGGSIMIRVYGPTTAHPAG